MALLHAELFLLLDQVAQILEAADLRPGLPLHQIFADVDPLLKDRDHRLDLGDRRGVGRSLSLSLRPPPVEFGGLGALLAGLVEEQLAFASRAVPRATGAAISCGTGTAHGALRRLKISGDDTIALFGQGPMGLSATQLAAAMGPA